MSEYLARLLERTSREAKISGKRKWTAVPSPREDIPSLQNAVLALKDRSAVQSRETGDVLDSFLTVRDLITFGLVDAEGLDQTPGIANAAANAAADAAEASVLGTIEDPFVESADLTNGGADDISVYEFSHTLEDGYDYVCDVIHPRNVSGNTWMGLQVQTLGGSFRSGATDYYGSHQVATTTTTSSHAAASFQLYDFSTYAGGTLVEAAAYILNVRVLIRHAMSSSLNTDFRLLGSLHKSAVAFWTVGSGACNTAEQNDALRIVVESGGNFSNGTALLYRYKTSAR